MAAVLKDTPGLGITTQDKRENGQEVLNLPGDRFALFQQCLDICRQLGNRRFRGRGDGYRDGLGLERGEDLVDQCGGIFPAPSGHPVQHLLIAGLLQLRWPAVVDEHLDYHFPGDDAASQRAFQVGVDLSEHTAQPVDRPDAVLGNFVV